MRAVLIALLFVVPFSYALLIETTGTSGANPVMYGELIAYESDGEIRAFDIARSEDYSFGSGSSPNLFGFTLVFETRESDADLNGDGDADDTVIQFVNVRDKKISSTNLVGRNPVVFADVIFFSTKESEMGVDFNNDNDEDDDIIRYYDIKSKELVNTRVVGDFPTVSQNYVVFETSESQAGVDLNGDGDVSDMIIRVFDRKTKKVENTRAEGRSPAIAKTDMVVFVSDETLVFLDVKSLQVKKTEINGDSPSIFSDTVLFSHDGSLYGYNLDTSMHARLGVNADAPWLFERRAAFVSNERDVGDLNKDGDQDDLVIRYAKTEDIDGDDVFDFVDNCISVMNEDQNDSDSNGVGDACDVSKPKPVQTSSENGVVLNESAPEQVSSEARGGFSWWWLVLAVVLLPFVAKYGYRYYKKRQKSFGF